MARSTTYNQLLARAASHGRRQPIWGEQVTATTASILAGTPQISLQRVGRTKALPSSLPTGVAGFIPTRFTVSSATGTALWLVRLVDMGSLDISSNTFTDGSAMPTVTELNTSRALPGIVLVEVTTVLNATPGSLSITYTDQSGNTAANTAQAMTASSAVGSMGIVNFNAGDTGAVDITTAARTGGTTPTGVVKFWGVIPVAMVYNTLQIGETVDLLTTRFAPHFMGTSEELYVLAGSITSANTVVQGSVFYIGDS